MEVTTSAFQAGQTIPTKYRQIPPVVRFASLLISYPWTSPRGTDVGQSSNKKGIATTRAPDLNAPKVGWIKADSYKRYNDRNES